MQWLYHIPHEWESSDQRTNWEDIYLIPADRKPDTPSIWVTVDAIDHYDDPSEALALLGERDWVLYKRDATDMLVKAKNLNLTELLHWAKVWLEAHGFTCSELVFAPIEAFAGTNEHADLIIALENKHGPNNPDS